MNTKNTWISEITGQKPEIKPEAKSDSILNADNSVSTSNKSVRCDACGCAFTPEILTQREGEIEYTFFRCAYCGKAYMVSITDEKLRQDIAKYVVITKKDRLTSEETQKAIELLRANKERAELLRHQYFKENGE